MQVYSNKKNKQVISGEQVIENSDVERHTKGKDAASKKTKIEILEDERPIEQYYDQKQNYSQVQDEGS